MSVAQASILIAAPPEVIWDFICNCDNWPVFAPGVEKSVQITGHGFERGAQFELNGHLLMVPVSFTTEAIAAERPHITAIRSVIGTFEFTAECTIEPTPYGSATTMRVDIEPEFGGLFAGLADAVSSLAYRTLLQSKMMQVADVIDGGNRESLTKVQKKVLRQLQQRKTDVEIADRLNLSPRVVKQHVETILRAMKVPVREALIHADVDNSGEIA